MGFTPCLADSREGTSWRKSLMEMGFLVHGSLEAKQADGAREDETKDQTYIPSSHLHDSPGKPRCALHWAPGKLPSWSNWKLKLPILLKWQTGEPKVVSLENVLQDLHTLSCRGLVNCSLFVESCDWGNIDRIFLPLYTSDYKRCCILDPLHWSFTFDSFSFLFILLFVCL